MLPAVNNALLEMSLGETCTLSLVHLMIWTILHVCSTNLCYCERFWFVCLNFWESSSRIWIFELISFVWIVDRDEIQKLEKIKIVQKHFFKSIPQHLVENVCFLFVIRIRSPGMVTQVILGWCRLMFRLSSRLNSSHSNSQLYMRQQTT